MAMLKHVENLVGVVFGDYVTTYIVANAFYHTYEHLCKFMQFIFEVKAGIFQLANDYQLTKGKNVNAIISKNKASLISAVDLPFLEKGLLEYMEGDELTEFVGNSIYPSIVNSFGLIFAPKIAGMLLDRSAKIDF